MSYITINEELRIQSCGIEDILREKESFVEPIEFPDTITVIYNPVTDTVIVNSDNKDFEFYTLLVDSYLAVGWEKRSEMRQHLKEISEIGFDGILDLLHKVARSREAAELKEQYAKELKIIGEQTAFWDQRDMLNVIDRVIEESGSSFMKLINAYDWGYIQGIRAERARRKKVTA